ncbi:MFS transporter [Aggregatilineales bacterium SYSU G02658]
MKSISDPDSWQHTLAVAIFAQLVTAIGFNMFIPFLPLYATSLDSTLNLSVEAAAGLTMGAAGITSMFATALWGAIADRYGRKVMLLRATFGGVVVLGLMAFVSTVEQLIMLRLAQGFITGTVAATNALVAAETPRERVGFAMSTLQSALWGGLAVGPLIGGLLADRFGYAVPFLFIAGLLFICGVSILLGIHEHFDYVPAEFRASILDQWRQALAVPGISVLLGMRFLSGSARMTLAPLLALFIVTLLPPNADNLSLWTGIVSSVGAITGIIGGLTMGRMGDRIGQRRGILMCSMVALTAFVPQAFVHDVHTLILLQAVTGLAFGGLLAALGGLMGQLSRHGSEGAVWGLDGSVSAATFAFAPLFGSTVASLFGVRSAFIFAGLLYLAVFALAYLYLPRKRAQAATLAVGD